MSSVKDLELGLRWNCGPPTACEVSCQPLNPRVAEMFVLVSNSLRVTFIVHVPSLATSPVRFVRPSSDDVNSSQTSRSPRAPEPLVLLFSNSNLPDSTVVAPAPKIGWSTCAGES